MRMFIILLLIVPLSACTFSRAKVAKRAKSEMVGMSKRDVLLCMGAAHQKQKEGNIEVWGYGSGGDSTIIGGAPSTGAGFTPAMGIAKKRYCVVNLFFEGDTVASVSYSGNTGGLLVKGEQCAYAVEKCMENN